MFNKLAIANDHGGLDAKNMIVAWLREKGYAVTDYGTGSDEIVRYPYYASLVAGAVQRGQVDGGILICSTGIGMSMIANKFAGVRAALCTSSLQAKMTRLHNNANILCLGGKVSGAFEIMDMLEIWLATAYEGGRHNISLEMIRRAEEAMITQTGFVPPRDIDISKV